VKCETLEFRRDELSHCLSIRILGIVPVNSIYHSPVEVAEKFCCYNSAMRGKRKLRKIEVMSTDSEDVYECDCCAWLLRVAPAVSVSEVLTEFNSHDCKLNSLKKGPAFSKGR
jgi:hypothetical protein